MKTIDIKAQSRKELGKKATKKLRSENNVPCVMYGGNEILHFHAHENIFKDMIYTPNAYIINLEIEGKKFLAVLKETQFHPVSDKLEHIDFMQVNEDKAVILPLPIKLVGVSPGVKAGGKMRQKRRVLNVKGLIKDLPDALEVDISTLEIGVSIKIHELSYNNLEILDPTRAMVVAVISSRLALKDMEIEEVVVETEEDAEGAEGEEDAEGASTPEKDGAKSEE